MGSLKFFSGFRDGGVTGLEQLCDLETRWKRRRGQGRGGIFKKGVGEEYKKTMC